MKIYQDSTEFAGLRLCVCLHCLQDESLHTDRQILAAILNRKESGLRSQQATPRTAGAYEISAAKSGFLSIANERNVTERNATVRCRLSDVKHCWRMTSDVSNEVTHIDCAAASRCLPRDQTTVLTNQRPRRKSRQKRKPVCFLCCTCHRRLPISTPRNKWTKDQRHTVRMKFERRQWSQARSASL